jgi:hypothetical protein
MRVDCRPNVIVKILTRHCPEARGVLHGATFGIPRPHRGTGRRDETLVAVQRALLGSDVPQGCPDAEQALISSPHRVEVHRPLLVCAPPVEQPARDPDVAPGLPSGQHLPQCRHHGRSDRLAMDVRHASSNPIRHGATGHLGHRGVDPPVPQVSVEVGQP